MNRRNFLSSLGILAALPSINLKQVVESKPIISQPLFYQVNTPTFLAFHLDKTENILRSQPVIVSTFKYEGEDVLEYFVKHYSKENHVMVYSATEVYDPVIRDNTTFIRAAFLHKSKNWILQSFKPYHDYSLMQYNIVGNTGVTGLKGEPGNLYKYE